MKKRNPIAKAVKHIRPQVIPYKRRKLMKPTIDLDPEDINDDRTPGEVISSIRDLSIQIDVLTTIMNDELDMLRRKWNTASPK